MEDLDKLSREELIETIVRMAEKIAELEARLKQNSTNSSKSPSSDVWKPAKMPRPQTGAPPGGQRGHKGNFLKFESEADITIELRTKSCKKCGTAMPETGGSVVEERHKIDVEVRTVLTKYACYEVSCPCCGKENREEFPADIKSHVSYGEGIKSIGVLLTNHANVSYGKTAEIMDEVFGVPISAGTLVNHVGEFAIKSEPVLTEIAENVKQGEVANFDETGIRVNGKKGWLHNAGNSEATYNTFHAKRGKVGTDDNGVLKEFGGTAMHDCLKQYFSYTNARHALCNAHLLRELQGVIENTDLVWAAGMKAHLLEVKKTVDDFKAAGLSALPGETLFEFNARYGRILALGETECPLVPGQSKRSKPRNLLDRFIKYETEINRFMNDFKVPFTNNQAERDIRIAKVKMKISGCFRSNAGAKNFAKISSVIGTAGKQGLSALKTVSNIFVGSLNSIFNIQTSLV